jgi:hypothetical protein
LATRSKSVAARRYGVNTLRPPYLQETLTLSMPRGSCFKRFVYKPFDSLFELHSKKAFRSVAVA